MIKETRHAIGGDFELNTIPLGCVESLSKLTRDLSGTWVISGRSGLALILRQLRDIGICHVHIPAYLCKAILLPIKALGLEYSFYPVDMNLVAYPDPPLGAAVLLIHYFGWLNPATTALRAEAPESFHLIEDFSHALLSDWGQSINWAFFSLRKFAPVLLGGWANINADAKTFSVETDSIAWRTLATRLLRGHYLSHHDIAVSMEIERLYLESFRAIETFLNEQPIGETAPPIALMIAAGLDWKMIAVRRQVNWRVLHGLLGGNKNILSSDVVPYGYIIQLEERDALRTYLANSRIFCPVHWSLPVEVCTKRFPIAAKLAKSCLTLPIDQRYTFKDMESLAEAIGEYGVDFRRIQ